MVSVNCLGLCAVKHNKVPANKCDETEKATADTNKSVGILEMMHCASRSSRLQPTAKSEEIIIHSNNY